MTDTAQLANLKRLFDRFDADHNGHIDSKEIMKLLEEHGTGNDDGILAALASLKPKTPGHVSWDEFRTWWSRVATAPQKGVARPRGEETPDAEPTVPYDVSAPDLHVVFARFDLDGSGEMDANELGKLLEALGIDPDDDELAATMKRLDTDRSGKISFEELEAWWDEQ